MPTGASWAANIRNSDTELVIGGPGRIYFGFKHALIPGPDLPDKLEFELRFGVAGAGRDAVAIGTLDCIRPNRNWVFHGPSQESPDPQSDETA